MDPLRLSAEAILGISIAEPERLFSRERLLSEFRALTKMWHPDVSKHPKASDVLAHIVLLHGEAERHDTSNSWQVPGVLELSCIDNKLRKIPYRKKHPFELGMMYYGPSYITFVVEQQYADLVHSAQREIGRFTFRDAGMEKEIRRYLPTVHRAFETKDGMSVLMLAKTEDVFLLRDLMNANGGTIEPVHIAWVLNTIYNIACYLEFSKLTHNAITVDTYFVSPKYHSGLLLGGWWYATNNGAHMNALPAAAIHLAPSGMLKLKQASEQLDLSMIRAMGREMLGDITGMGLLYKTGVPEPMAQFLRQPTTGSARRDYEIWSAKVLPASFGKRRFIGWPISAHAVYA